MSSSLIVEILLALIAATIGFVSLTQARSANKEQKKMAQAQAEAVTATVDAGAYARAREIYEGALATLREELDTTRKDVQDLRASNLKLTTQLQAVRKDLFDARRELMEAQESNASLLRQVNLLRSELAQVRGNNQ